MAVLIRHRAEGMDAAQYDEISPPLVEKVKTQPGFLIHVAYMDNGRWTVSEVWESQEQHDRWFDENVEPNVPAKIEQEVIELHAVHLP
jgi:quinol monooxygenase YgiN